MNLKELAVNTGNWIDSLLDRDYWKALEYATMNLWISHGRLILKS